LIYY